jgi:DNA-binding MarR family transcriptional regulator
MAQTTGVSNKTLEKILDYIYENPGVGITEISKGIGRSTSSVSVGLQTLIKKGVVSKGVQKLVLKSGDLSDKLTPGYYLD